MNEPRTKLEKISNEQLVARIRVGEGTAGNMLKLWQQNKAFVSVLARKYKGYAEMDDLMQEGYLGLNDAVEHYEIGSDVPFINYAAFWIRQKMTRYLEQTGAIRLPSAMYQSVIRYKKFVGRYIQEHDHMPSEGICKAFLGMNGEELDKVRKASNRTNTNSLEATISNDDGMTLGDTIASDQNVEEDAIRKRDLELMSVELWDAVASLPENQALAITGRYKDGEMLKELGVQLGCSFQYVRDLERKALRTLRKPHICQRFQPYFECYLSAASIHNVGVAAFRRTWTSSTERDAIRAEKRRERLKESKDRQDMEQVFVDWALRLEQTEEPEEFKHLQEQFEASMQKV